MFFIQKPGIPLPRPEAGSFLCVCYFLCFLFHSFRNSICSSSSFGSFFRSGGSSISFADARITAQNRMIPIISILFSCLSKNLFSRFIPFFQKSIREIVFIVFRFFHSSAPPKPNSFARSISSNSSVAPVFSCSSSYILARPTLFIFLTAAV